MAHHAHHPVARRLAGGLQRFRFAVIAFWLAVVALGLAFGLRFLDATVSDFPAPKGRSVYVQSRLVSLGDTVCVDVGYVVIGMDGTFKHAALPYATTSTPLHHMI